VHIILVYYLHSNITDVKLSTSLALVLGPIDTHKLVDVKTQELMKKKLRLSGDETLEERLQAVELENTLTEKEGKSKEVPKAESLQVVLMQALHTNDNSLLEIVLQINDQIIINTTVQRLPSSFVLPFLTTVVEKFQTKPARGISLINWIRAVLVQHTSYLMTVPDLLRTLSPLYSTVDSRLASFKKINEIVWEIRFNNESKNAINC